MTIPDPLQEIANDVVGQSKKRRAKVRTLLGWFGYSRRREHVVKQISEALESVRLRTEPDIQDEFLDNQVYFVRLAGGDHDSEDKVDELETDPPKTELTEEIEEYEPPEEIAAPVTLSIIDNPTFRGSHFAYAPKAVVSVLPDDTISQATMTMLLKDIDQIPVMRGSRRGELEEHCSSKRIQRASRACY
ncbi:hypothetical protein [Rhodopirellula sp. P2]|uniref:hypothetical protein n=1 Tax=Rhodopirellula sp. P2 TaxID=2127060 RepID=UPI0023676895|nr:hypothetical protein [Rhodopirellula sp. P2]WDQ16780.1 hypothetical protein PSR62_24655 [Rhodopirellula sp. P2]